MKRPTWQSGECGGWGALLLAVDLGGGRVGNRAGSIKGWATQKLMGMDRVVAGGGGEAKPRGRGRGSRGAWRQTSHSK